MEDIASVYARSLFEELLRLGVMLVEQPLPAGADDALAEIARFIGHARARSKRRASEFCVLTSKF